MNFNFEEFGDGKPIILLHAFPLHRNMWQGQIDTLTKLKCRVILPDLKGFGENNAFSDVNRMEEMAHEIAALMNYLQIHKAIIGGLSMGGYVTLNLYRLFPDKFSALMLFDTNSAADDEEKSQLRLDLIEKIENHGLEALVENMLPKLISDFTKTENPTLVRELENFFYEADEKAVIATLRGLAERLDHSYILSSISLPTLLCFGAEDKVTNLETARFMEARIPNSKLSVIPRAGHYSNLEQPEIFNSALADFIKNIGV